MVAALLVIVAGLLPAHAQTGGYSNEEFIRHLAQGKVEVSRTNCEQVAYIVDKAKLVVSIEDLATSGRLPRNDQRKVETFLNQAAPFIEWSEKVVDGRKTNGDLVFERRSGLNPRSAAQSRAEFFL